MASARLVAFHLGHPSGPLLLDFSRFWTHFFRSRKPSKNDPFKNLLKSRKINPMAPQGQILNEISCFLTSIFGSKKVTFREPPKPCFLTTVQRFSMISPLKSRPFWHQKSMIFYCFSWNAPRNSFLTHQAHIL